MQNEVDRRSKLTSIRFDECVRVPQDLLRSITDFPTLLYSQDVLAELLERLRGELHFDYVSLNLVDPDTKMIHGCLDAGDRQLSLDLASAVEVFGVVVEQQQPFEVSNAEEDDRLGGRFSPPRKAEFRSFLVVPLSTDRQKLGTLAVFRRKSGKFSEEDVCYLKCAARVTALIVENALMAALLAGEKARLETLLQVNNALSPDLEMENLFGEISRTIRQVIEHDLTHLALYDKGTDAMNFHILDVECKSTLVPAGTPVPMAESPAGIAHQRGEILDFGFDDLQHFGSEYTKRLLLFGVRHVSCFPLVSRGRKLGTLGLATKHDAPISEQDRALLSQIAAQVAVAIDNALAYDEIARLKDRLAKEKVYLEQELLSEHNFGEVVGNSAPLRHVLKQVEIAAPSDATVLILGETGTGKELIARAVHRLSSRHGGNFIKLNCAAIPTGLLESELFGHEKGAFTGAISQKIGRLELADKGTLFLDEIGEIPMDLQPKLLRVLQDHEFERLGGVRTIRVNVRLVAATNRDLAKAVEERQFRTDLYYRLNVFPIRLPALRERLGDIPLLVHYFVQKFARRMSKNIESIPSELIREFERWHWPGNVRELENFIERSVILTQGTVFFAPMTELRNLAPDIAKSPKSTLEAMEREYILRTLRESGGVIAGAHGAAARLGMKRTTLQSRIQKLGITRSEYES